MEKMMSLYDNDIVMSGRILTYGLTERERETVHAAMGQGLTEVEADDATDLIAVPAFMLIIRADALTAAERRMVLRYYREVGAEAVERVCWIAPPALCGDVPAWFRCRETVEEAVTFGPQDIPSCGCEDEADADEETVSAELTDALLDSVTEAQFDAMVLLSEASIGRYVMRADVNAAGDVAYYELFDEEGKDVSLLVISHRDEPIDQAAVKASEPDFDHYICVAMTREEKASYIENWLLEQEIDDLPPHLRELAERLNELFE